MLILANSQMNLSYKCSLTDLQLAAADNIVCDNVIVKQVCSSHKNVHFPPQGPDEVMKWEFSHL